MPNALYFRVPTTKNPKPYDQAFKSLSDRNPRGLLDVFGVLPADVDAEVEALPRDIAMRPLSIDTAYLIRQDGHDPYIAVFEAVTSWKSEIAERLACYGGLIGIKYRIPVRMYVLPLADYACPKFGVPVGKGEWGDVEVAARLRWIKPWEIDGKVVLERAWPELDAWAVLFNLSNAQEVEVLGRLNQQGRGEDATLFRILGGMRYRRKKQIWVALLERMKQMIRPELFLESLAVEDWREEGRQEGRQEGELLAARNALLAIIHARFPKLFLTRAIESCTDTNAIQVLIPKIATARDAAAVKRLVDQLPQ